MSVANAAGAQPTVLVEVLHHLAQATLGAGKRKEPAAPSNNAIGQAIADFNRGHGMEPQLYQHQTQLLQLCTVTHAWLAQRLVLRLLILDVPSLTKLCGRDEWTVDT